MRKNRPNKLFSHIVALKPGEGKLVALLFVCFFLIACPHTIIKALRYADLLWRIGPGGLPIAYLFAAVVTGLVVIFHTRIHSKVSRQIMMVASLVFFIITGVLLHIILLSDYGAESAYLSYFYWVWSSVLTIVLVTQFWMIINEVFNPREAKRLIGFCGSGGILGGIVGGLLARFLTKANLTNLLLPLACALLFACIFVVRAIFVIRRKKLSSSKSIPLKQELSEPPKIGFRDNFNTVRKNKYTLLISLLVSITVIVSTFIDFQFSSAVNDHFRIGYIRPKEAMQAFFGLFSSGVLTFSFLLNLFLTRRILIKFRTRFGLLLTPLTLFFCSLGVIFAPFTLIPAILIKGSDEGLAFSLHQSVKELLYIPVASRLKAKVKPFIDMFVNRLAKVFAALLLLIIALCLNKEIEGFTPVLDPGLSKDLVWGILPLLVLWAVIGLKIDRGYRDVIIDGIKILAPPRVEKDLEKKLDVDSIKLIFDAIESKSRSSVLYAMHLFDLFERDKLTPEIKEMISEKTSEVTASSLGDLFNAEGATWFLESEDDNGQESFVTDIREVMSSEAYQHVMQQHIERMTERGEISEIEKMEMAKLIGLMDPDLPLVKKLEVLISDDSPEVSCYAIRSAAKLKKDGLIPAVIQKLDDPKTQEEAISALRQYGHSALSALEEFLHDNEQDMNIRKAVVKVLAGIGSQEVARVLLGELDRKPRELELEIIDALDRIRTEKADIQFPITLAKRATLRIIKKYFQTFIDLQNLEPDSKNEEQRHRKERLLETYFRAIFNALGLYYPHENIIKAFQHLKRGTRDSTAKAIELLDVTLKKDMKDIVLPLVEDLNPSDRERKFKRLLRNLDPH